MQTVTKKKKVPLLFPSILLSLLCLSREVHFEHLGEQFVYAAISFLHSPRSGGDVTKWSRHQTNGIKRLYVGSNPGSPSPHSPQSELKWWAQRSSPSDKTKNRGSTNIGMLGISNVRNFRSSETLQFSQL